MRANHHLSPIFDIDDLGFFHYYDLALRHTDLKQGLREIRMGNNLGGDAVSLANYGFSEVYGILDSQYVLDMNTCIQFQTKVEQFIYCSFYSFHESDKQYKDASFLVLKREEAKNPYDFGGYPLGKCGTHPFSKDQIIASVTTDKFENADINHAVLNVMMELKRELRKFKLQMILELRNKVRDISPREKLLNLMQSLTTHHSNNTLLMDTLFLDMAKALEDPDLDSSFLEEFTARLAKVEANKKKGEDMVHVIFQPFNPTDMSSEEITNKLLHYVNNQNSECVRKCIEQLREKNYNEADDENLIVALYRAASKKSLEILKLIYEFNPAIYDSLIASDEYATAIFQAARCCQLANLTYLLDRRSIVPRDLRGELGEHILCGPAMLAFEDSVAVIELLLHQGVTIGNEVTNGHHNAFVQAATGTQPGHVKILDILLPRANSWSKFLGILAATNELYYGYGHKPRKKLQYKSVYVNSMFVTRRMILESLTADECVEIRRLFFETKEPCRDKEAKYVVARTILLSDLLDFEQKIDHGPNSKITLNISRCFAQPENREVPASTVLVAGLFSPRAAAIQTDPEGFKKQMNK